jgi:hypothetical protein
MTRLIGFLSAILILLAMTILPGATAENTLLLASPSTSCGPPNYCAPTDRRVQPYPVNPPSLGPAGSVVKDPTFGSRIVRVTDAKADPQGKGRWFSTPSSAEQNPWNSSSTAFYVSTAGGQFVLYEFNPSDMAVRQQRVIKVPWQGEPQFSYTNPDILYGVRSRDAAFQQYNISTGQLETIHATSECMKSDTPGHSITVSADDNRMSTSIGPQQDRNYAVYVYDRKQGCRWFNTETGEIGGQWGPKGQISIPDRLKIHNERMSKSGKYIWIQRGGGGPGRFWLLWEVETMNVVSCPLQCKSHQALGYSHGIGGSGFTHPMDLIMRPLDRLEQTRHLVADLRPLNGARYWFDAHFSWNNVDANDSRPICMSTYRPDNPKTGGPPNVDNPWDNEILCVETDGKDSKIWRFAHTYSTAKNGFWSTPRGNVSPDGRFFMFTSDWQNQLGPTPSGNGYRTDVFIVELK